MVDRTFHSASYVSSTLIIVPATTFVFFFATKSNRCVVGVFPVGIQGVFSTNSRDGVEWSAPVVDVPSSVICILRTTEPIVDDLREDGDVITRSGYAA